MEMSRPRNVKEVQRLSGQIASVSRFLPQCAGKAAPIHKCIKKIVEFKWTTECEKAFQELKTVLATPHVLAKPTPELPLQLYFTVIDKVVGSVLVQDNKMSQKIIYFSAMPSKEQNSNTSE